jgi:hypothetical protein
MWVTFLLFVAANRGAIRVWPAAKARSGGQQTAAAADAVEPPFRFSNAGRSGEWVGIDY